MCLAISRLTPSAVVPYIIKRSIDIESSFMEQQSRRSPMIKMAS